MQSQSVLSEEVTNHSTFETIGQTFNSSLSKCDTFSIGLSLTTLLQNEDLIPEETQKLSALFILYELYRNDNILNNPFVSVFVQILVSLLFFIHIIITFKLINYCIQ